MKILYRRPATLALLAAFLLGLSTAHAHVLPQERKLVAQISADRVEILIEYLEPPGDRADLLQQRFDLNRDGELRGPEAKLAGGVWIKHVLRGLQLEVVGESPAALEPEIKFHREQKGALTSLLYVRWELPKLDADTPRTLRIKLLGEKNTVPTALLFRPGEHTEIREIAVPIRFKAAPDAAVLDAGEHAHLRVGLTDAALE